MCPCPALLTHSVLDPLFFPPPSARSVLRMLPLSVVSVVLLENKIKVWCEWKGNTHTSNRTRTKSLILASVHVCVRAWWCMRACVALKIKRHNLSHKCITGFRAASESQLSQIDWLVYSNKFSPRKISHGSRVWHRTSYGFTSDRMPLCCSVFVCGCECMSVRGVRGVCVYESNAEQL